MDPYAQLLLEQLLLWGLILGVIWALAHGRT
jgi:hypothetical protein